MLAPRPPICLEIELPIMLAPAPSSASFLSLPLPKALPANPPAIAPKGPNANIPRPAPMPAPFVSFLPIPNKSGPFSFTIFLLIASNPFCIIFLPVSVLLKSLAACDIFLNSPEPFILNPFPSPRLSIPLITFFPTEINGGNTVAAIPVAAPIWARVRPPAAAVAAAAAFGPFPYILAPSLSALSFSM